MKIQKLKYIVFSDLHLGHDRNPTLSIIENFRAFLKDHDKVLRDLDIIFIAGDIFDKLIKKNTSESMLIDNWFIELVLYCELRNIKIRILEGTQSHDYKQSANIANIIQQLKSNVDFKYISTLHIEQMEDLGLSILYVPDEYSHDATETFKDVKTLLQEKGLTCVDIAIMHGQFNYQFPHILSKASHDEQSYLSIVKHYISIGHVHTSSVFDRILAQGSFDRLAQGEEEDKGAMLITILNDKHSYVFLKNKRAKVFITLDYIGKTLEEILTNLDADIKKIPHYSYVRILVEPDNHIVKSVKKVNEKYGFLFFKIESKRDKSLTIGSDIVSVLTPVESYNITPENIVELLDRELEKHTLTTNDMSIIHSELKLILEQVS